MSGQELVDELRQWARPNTTHSEKLVNRAADTIEAQAKAVDTWAEMAARRHQALGEVEASYREAIARAESAERALRATDDFRIADWQKLELERDEAEQKSTELAAVIAEARATLGDVTEQWKPLVLADILSAVPADVLSAYTTRIREEALAPIRALVMTTDGDYLAGDDFNGLAGCIQEALAEQGALWSEIPEGQNDA